MGQEFRNLSMASPQRSGMSSEEYLAWEAEQDGKHEYVAGEIFAMVGATDRHVTIAGNLFAALREHLRGGPCRVYIADMRLRVDAADAWFYPDVMVTCDPSDRDRELDKSAPMLIIEVLSPGTEAFDRGAKFAAYRSLPSLKEYLLADPVSGRLELYRRDASNHWVLHTPKPDEKLQLSCVDLELAYSAVFEDAEPG
jgi:Uma2 family endonuclease